MLKERESTTDCSNMQRLSSSFNIHTRILFIQVAKSDTFFFNSIISMWLKWSGWSFPHQGISDHNSLGFQQLKKKSLSFKKWVDQSGSWAITYLLQHEATSLGYISRPYTGNSYSFCVKYLVREGRVFFIVKLTHSGCMPQWACRCATLHRTKGAWIPRLSSYKNETRSSPGHNVPALNISESTYWEGDRDWWVAIKTIILTPLRLRVREATRGHIE